MRQLFHNGTIVTGEDSTVLMDGYIIVDNGQIKELGSKVPLDLNNYETIDLKGNWVLPGLINTHGHIGSALLRGYGDDLPLDEWLKTKMWPMEAKFTEETVKASAQLAMVEMLKSGTTTFLEMYHLHLDMIADLVVQSGMRSVLTRGMIGLCSTKEQEQKLQEACDLATIVSSKGEGRITSMLAPHAPYTCPPEFLKMIVSEAKKRNLPIHTHLSETQREVQQHIEKYGKRPALHLAELGVFDVHTLCAHGVHFNDQEIEVLAEKKVAISHNPISNLKLGSGIAAIPQLLSKNILVAIGTDSTASNNNLDMFQELRMAALIHKGKNEDPTAISASQAFQMATTNGARALALEKVGVLKEGNDADFIVVDHNSAHLQPTNHVMSHLVYSASGSDVSSVYVKGKCLVRNKELLTLDEEKIIFEANEAFNKLV